MVGNRKGALGSTRKVLVMVAMVSYPACKHPSEDLVMYAVCDSFYASRATSVFPWIGVGP